MNKAEEIILISRCVLFNDKRAFEKLVIEYQSTIRRFFLYHTGGNKSLSDDLAQETFIRSYINLHTFSGRAKFSTWLFRIAYNVFYDDYQKNRKSKTESVENIETSNQPSFSIAKTLDRSIDIYEALKFLKQEEKSAIILFYIEDLKHEEISKITNTPLGTVKTNILRGKEKLKQHLIKIGYERE